MKELNDAIYAKLDGDTTLRSLLSASHNIHPDVIPASWALPGVVYALQTPSSDALVYGRRAYESLVYAIQAIGAGYDPNPTDAIAARVDTLLDHVTLTISGHTQMLGVRVGRINYPEQGDAGDFYHHRGGLYRWMVQ